MEIKQRGATIIHVGIGAAFIFYKSVSEQILFQQIGIRADAEHDGTNVATTIDENEL